VLPLRLRVKVAERGLGDAAGVGQPGGGELVLLPKSVVLMNLGETNKN
jgi:hypothetical protein